MRARLIRASALLAGALVTSLTLAGTARADSYVPISGAGSTWSQNAIDQWRVNVNQYGLTVNYQGTGSSDGRNQFKNGTVDYAVSEIPYGLKDGGVTDSPPSRKYAYMPIVAGGTSFMYNLTIGGKRVTNLRLSGANVAKVFTGVITKWNDPAIAADNPQLTLPARTIVPVVRSDGSGTTAQLTAWMAKTQQSTWDAYCARAGLDTPCGQTSQYPVIDGSGFVAQSGSLGVSGYVKQSSSEGAITYVEYSYALNTNFPVVQVLNQAGYYTGPTAQNVAVALLAAKVNTDESSPNYLTPDLTGVYGNADPRTYPLSSYSYMILPTAVEGSFNADKGHSLGAFAYYFLCEGQQQADVLGYSALPINLVQAGLDQVKRIPGVDVQNIDIATCNNPTFSSDGTNTLAKTAPQPPDCAKQGPVQCAAGAATATGSTTSGASSGSSGSTGTRGSTTTTGKTSTTSGSGKTAAGSGRTGAAGTAAGVRTSTTGGSGPVTAVGTVPGGAAGPVTSAVDPVTGTAVQTAPGDVATGGSADPAQGAAAAPVSVRESLTGSQDGALMLVAGLILLALVVGPPLLSARLSGRDER